MRCSFAALLVALVTLRRRQTGFSRSMAAPAVSTRLIVNA